MRLGASFELRSTPFKCSSLQCFATSSRRVYNMYIDREGWNPVNASDASKSFMNVQESGQVQGVEQSGLLMSNIAFIPPPNYPTYSQQIAHKGLAQRGLSAAPPALYPTQGRLMQPGPANILWAAAMHQGPQPRAPTMALPKPQEPPHAAQLTSPGLL